MLNVVIPPCCDSMFPIVIPSSRVYVKGVVVHVSELKSFDMFFVWFLVLLNWRGGLESLCPDRRRTLQYLRTLSSVRRSPCRTWRTHFQQANVCLTVSSFSPLHFCFVCRSLVPPMYLPLFNQNQNQTVEFSKFRHNKK